MLECTGMEPMKQRMYLGGCHASRISRNRAGLVWIPHLIRAIQSVAVPGEINSGCVGMPGIVIVAIHYKQGKARGCSHNPIDFPVAEDNINRTTPPAAKLLAFAKRQIVGNASSERVVQVKVRKSPVQLLVARQWEVGRSRERAQPVRQSGIEGTGIGVPKQSVESMSNALGLRFDLQRIVVRFPYIVVVRNRKWEQEGRRAPPRRKSGSARPASQGISRRPAR